MRKKYPKAGAHEIMRYLGGVPFIEVARCGGKGRKNNFSWEYLTVQRFKRGWMRQPDYALVSGEQGA